MSTGCPFATLAPFFVGALLRRCVYVIKDHRTTWILCNNTTARNVSKWYFFMCIPQYFIAPLLALVERDTATAMFFGARIAATLSAKEIDHKYPYQRAVGLCHWMTFGPVMAWLVSQGYWGETKPDSIRGGFLWLQMRITAACLFMDARDLLFQMAGYPYPCYIREAVINNKIRVEDPRALKPVNWWNRIFGP